MTTHERELLTPTQLSLRGRLCEEAVGFSRQPRVNGHIQGRWGRRKRWEYWCVITREAALQITIADLDYLGIAEIACVELATGRVATLPLAVPLAARFRLPDRTGEPLRARTPFGTVHVEPGARETAIRVHVRGRGGRIDAEVVVATPPEEESLSVVVPWSERSFQLTTKRVALPAVGEIRALGRRFHVDRAHEGFAALDHGRGVWPYETTWNWGTGAAWAGARRVGLQLGGQWTDGTGATENGVFVDGRLDKIGATLTWEYDRRDFQKPWRVRDPHGAVDLAFTPALERVAKLDLGLLRTELHLCFGRWSGELDAHGERLRVDGALGWAEEHRARW